MINLPKFITEVQLKEDFDSIIPNSVKGVFIPLDIADYPIGFGYVVFNLHEDQQKALGLEREKVSFSEVRERSL